MINIIYTNALKKSPINIYFKKTSKKKYFAYESNKT